MCDPIKHWKGEIAALAGHAYRPDACSDWKAGYDYAVRTHPLAYARARQAERAASVARQSDVQRGARNPSGALPYVGKERDVYLRALAAGLSEEEAEVAVSLLACWPPNVSEDPIASAPSTPA